MGKNTRKKLGAVIQWNRSSFSSFRKRIKLIGTKRVLLLHGNSDHVHCWDWTAERLPKNWSVVGYDFPGHGDSNFPENYYAPTHDLFGYSIRYVVDALGRVPNSSITIFGVGNLENNVWKNDEILWTCYSKLCLSAGKAFIAWLTAWELLLQLHLRVFFQKESSPSLWWTSWGFKQLGRQYFQCIRWCPGRIVWTDGRLTLQIQTRGSTEKPGVNTKRQSWALRVAGSKRVQNPLKSCTTDPRISNPGFKDPKIAEKWLQGQLLELDDGNFKSKVHPFIRQWGTSTWGLTFDQA